MNDIQLYNGDCLEVMNNFIEIKIGTTEYVVNANQVTQMSYYNHVNKGRIYFVDGNWIDIDKEQYKEIKAKLIDNNLKE